MFESINNPMPMTTLLYAATAMVSLAGGILVGRWWEESYYCEGGARIRLRMSAIGITLGLVIVIGELVRCAL